MGFDRALGGRIVRMAIPVVLAMLSQTAVNLLDTIMVGRLPAEHSIAGQAGIGHSMILLWAVGGFLSALGIGTQAITARRYGEERFDRAGQVLTNALFLTFLAGLVFSLAGFLLTPWIFPFFNPNPSVLREGIPYCQLRMLGVVSMVTTAAVKGFYDGVGRTRVHMVAALGMNATNIILNYVLIFGAWGFPRLNTTGAGLASLIASYMGLAFMLFWTGRRADRARYQVFRWRNLSARVSWEITRLSVPSGLATVAVMSGFGLFLKIVAELDAIEAASALVQQASEAVHRPAIYTAAAKVIIDILSISFMGSIAFGMATATLVSQSLGARRPELAARYGWESVKIGFAAMTALGILTIIFPEVVLSLFSKDQAVIDAAIPSLRLMAAFEGLIAAGLVLAQALYGAGNTKYVMYVELVLHFTCLVPLAWLFGVVLGGGPFGVWLAAATYIAALAGLMAWKFHEGKWKSIRL
jgi:Na+-driven multidrug efflux pump